MSEITTVWCVSDGRAGIERQTIAVANALSELMLIETKVVRLTPQPPQVWLPSAFWPAPLAALPSVQRDQLVPPWPDVWIGNGRRAIPYSLQAEKWSGRKSVVVQLQNPRIDSARFDLVVPPRHDKVRGNNVVETLGAPVWFTQTQINAAKAAFPDVATQTGQKVMVILGGPSKRHRFTADIALRLIDALKVMASNGARLLMTASRRTPKDVVDLCRTFARTYDAAFYANEAQDGPNPYLAWLAMADVALVTEDSTNMMTDAAFFGLPIHLVKLAGGDRKFDRLHKSFVDAGAARWFSGELQSWTYEPIRDAMHVAEEIRKLLLVASWPSFDG